ncbi:MAG: nucleotidyltransferase family protein [Caldilineaceae bacterium]|nr:nucleotidyltransferase family protein [Caldilineaceae bacterium]
MVICCNGDILRNMNYEESLVCQCVRQNFAHADATKVHTLATRVTICWSTVLAIAEDHLVAPLVHKNLQYCVDVENLAVPEQILQAFKMVAIENTVHQKWRRQKLGELMQYLHSQGIGVMFAKSIALTALVYEHEWYTTPDDIDLLLDRPKAAIDGKQRAVIAAYEAFGIESDAFAHHDLNMNGILPIDFAQVWKDAYQIEFDGYPVYVMAPEDMLISLCVNAARKRYFRLKAMFDIVELIAGSPQLDWHHFVEKVRAYDVTLIVYAALYSTQQYLDLALPTDLLTALQIHPLRALLIRLILRFTSLSASSQLRTANWLQLFGRQLSPSVTLRYLTLRWYQIIRQLRFTLSTPRAQFDFWDGE